MSILDRVTTEYGQDDKNVETPEETQIPPVSKSPPSTEEKPSSQAKLGKTILIRGELTGEEDLIIEGRVEGQINLKNHNLVVGEGGNVEAEVFAKSVIVLGQLKGNLNAEEKVEIKASGSLTGDIQSPRAVIEDGAKFKGCIDMNATELK